MGVSYFLQNDRIAIQGDYISNIYHYTFIRIEKVNTDDANNFIKDLRIAIFKSDYIINTQIKTDSPITFTIKAIEIPLETM